MKDEYRVKLENEALKARIRELEQKLAEMKAAEAVEAKAEVVDVVAMPAPVEGLIDGLSELPEPEASTTPDPAPSTPPKPHRKSRS